MVNDTPPGRWFRRLTWVAIAANLVAALPLLAAPVSAAAMAGLPAVGNELWPRLAALQIMLLSICYMPAGIDIDRYRAMAWMVVGSHLAGALFFALAPGYHLLALYDFLFAVPLGVLLTLALRSTRQAAVPAATL